jgi:hypothetical protein
MKNVMKRLTISALLITTLCVSTVKVQASEFVVYSVFRALDFGNAGEDPKKDFYVNMGSANGVHVGSVLSVSRRVPTYDMLNEKLYKDVQIPIAHLKVIHVENNAAVARLDQLSPEETTPVVAYRAVMVGDSVELAQ